MPPPATIVVDSDPPPSGCQYCDAEAIAACPRCGTWYCERHGGTVCDSCSRPAGGLPSAVLFRAVAVILIAGGILAFVLLVSRPRLPGEQPPAQRGAPPAATSTGAGAPRTTATATPSPVPQTYTVKAGDTFNAIAGQLGIDADALRAANPGIDPGSLQIGQQLVIPARR